MTDDRKQAAGSALNSIIGTGKDLVALVRDLLLLWLAVFLIASPGGFNSFMVKAGVQSADIGGINWKAQAADSNQTLQDQQGVISKLQEKSDELLNTLTALKPQVPSIGDRLTKLQQDNNQLKAESKRVTGDATEKIKTYRLLANLAPKK